MLIVVIVRNSISPFNFPLVVVKKNLNNEGNLKLRILFVCRKLNEITGNEAYGLPNLMDILKSNLENINLKTKY